MHSILKYATGLETRPYPHVIISDALDYYEELAATRPDLKSIINGREYGENERIDLAAPTALKMQDMAPVWREFLEYHSSPQFWRDICEIFGQTIAANYPKHNPYVPPPDPANPPKITMRLGIGVNTPTTKEESIRGPHIDSTNELIAGLLYMPIPGDDAGGDLEIHELTGPPLFTSPSELLGGLSRRVKTVPYKANTFVMFLNTPYSIHAVTPRKPTKLERRLVSFAVDANCELFPIYGPVYPTEDTKCLLPKFA